MFVCKVCMRNCAHICGLVEPGMPTLAFTADSRQTEAGRLYNRSEEDETRTPLQKAIDDADYEHGHRVNELDFLTAFHSPVMVARKSNCAFNTVRISSTGRPWIVDNDSRGGDDEHAQPNAELAIELTGQTRAERRTRFNLRTKMDIPLSALLRATFTTRRHLEDRANLVRYPKCALPYPLTDVCHGSRAAVRAPWSFEVTES